MLRKDLFTSWMMGCPEYRDVLFREQIKDKGTSSIQEYIIDDRSR
jgi:hypothetical protein